MSRVRERTQLRSDALGSCGHQNRIHWLAGFEHADLQLRAVSVMTIHRAGPDRLDDEVDVTWNALGV